MSAKQAAILLLPSNNTLIEAAVSMGKVYEAQDSKFSVVWSQLNFSLHSSKYTSQNSELCVFNQHCSLFQIRLWLWPPVIILPATIKPSKQYFSCFDVDWNCIYCWMMIRLNVTNVSKGNRSTSLLLIHHNLILSVSLHFCYCWCIPLYLYLLYSRNSLLEYHLKAANNKVCLINLVFCTSQLPEIDQ